MKYEMMYVLQWQTILLYIVTSDMLISSRDVYIPQHCDIYATVIDAQHAK